LSAAQRPSAVVGRHAGNPQLAAHRLADHLLLEKRMTTELFWPWLGYNLGYYGGIFFIVLAPYFLFIHPWFERRRSFVARWAAAPIYLLGWFAVWFWVIPALQFDREQEIKSEFSRSEFSPNQRDDFARNFKLGCVETQQQSEFNRQMGVTDRQIAVYCDCSATHAARVVEIDELKYFALNRRMPETFTRKIAAASQTCNQAALGR
jgi:hypothetical protein